MLNFKNFKIIKTILLTSPLLFGSCHASQSEQSSDLGIESIEELTLTTEPELQEESLDSFLENCGRQAWWDQYQLVKLGEKSVQDKVTMFALFYGEEAGDPRDGEFIAKLLPLYKKEGWNYVALEADRKFDRYIGTPELESTFKAVHGNHWFTYAPIIQAAQKLGMNIIFYDQPLSDIDQSGEGHYSFTRGEAQFSNIKRVFDQDPHARIITVGGVGHAFDHPVEKSWLEPDKVTPLGMLLRDYIGTSQITRVMLQPEDPSILSIHFDSSFYLAKSCPQDVTPLPPEVPVELRRFRF